MSIWNKFKCRCYFLRFFSIKLIWSHLHYYLNNFYYNKCISIIITNQMVTSVFERKHQNLTNVFILLSFKLETNVENLYLNHNHKLIKLEHFNYYFSKKNCVFSHVVWAWQLSTFTLSWTIFTIKFLKDRNHLQVIIQIHRFATLQPNSIIVIHALISESINLKLSYHLM